MRNDERVEKATGGSHFSKLNISAVLNQIWARKNNKNKNKLMVVHCIEINLDLYQTHKKNNKT